MAQKVLDLVKLDFDDVLIQPVPSSVNSRKNVSLVRSFTTKHSRRKITGIPIISANMDVIATHAMSSALTDNQLFFSTFKYHPPFWNGSPELTFVSTGIESRDLDTLRDTLYKYPYKAICVDVANGYTDRFLSHLSDIRYEFPDYIIIAGNVITPEQSANVIEAGADIVKIGLGSGMSCRTRQKTGIGYPQLSAILDCESVVHKMGGLLCSDGGCKSPGDIAKAFGANADFVMIGYMLAGHTECLSNEFYGMASRKAQEKYSGSLKDYRASEGAEIIIPERGSVRETIQDILGGLRSACTYVDANSLDTFSQNVTFIRVSK